MAHFIIEYRQTGSAETREAHRGEHIAYRKSFGDKMPLTGPLLDDADKPVGSLIIVEADDKDAATAMATNDPYIKLGVLELVSVRGYRIAAMKPPQT